MNPNPFLGTTRHEPELMMEINTTPLIDVMLVLLVMLIITIPLQLHAVNLQLPNEATSVQADAAIVRIDVAADNSVSIDGLPVTDREALDAILIEVARNQHPQPELQINANALARYDAVASVLASAQRQGLSKLSILGIDRFFDE